MIEAAFFIVLGILCGAFDEIYLSLPSHSSQTKGLPQCLTR